MKTREAILSRIEAFIAANGMTERRFGLLAANDHKFVDRLRRQSVTLARIEAAERFMAQACAPTAQPADATSAQAAA